MPDLALSKIILGVRGLTCEYGFANENTPVFKINVFPLQAINLAGAHASKKTDHKILIKIFTAIF
jgi:hypothetical protein